MKEVRTLVDILEQRAASSPDALAYAFLADGERESARVTRAQLRARALAIASELVEQGVRPGDRAILMYPPGLEFIGAFFGALYAGVIAVPCYPPHPSQVARALPRLLGIVDDCSPRVVLAPDCVLSMAGDIGSRAPALSALRWIGTGTTESVVSAHRLPTVAQGATAFLQYTSGSTSSPRGVVVSHANLLHNLGYANEVEGNDASSVAVSWLPVIHDMGLIEGVLEPLYGGYPAYLMAPAGFLQRPARWLRAISRYRATNSGGPNFAYDLCLRKVSEEILEGLDLTSWRVAYNGAEPIRASTLVEFHRRFAPCGFRWSAFYPVYGLAESTLLVSSGDRAYEPVIAPVDSIELQRGNWVERPGRLEQASRLVSSGRVGCGTTVRIVDPETRMRRQEGRVGEIWIDSPSVAGGYWNRPDETEATFRARLVGDGNRPWLRTGDLGVVVNGELFVVGRLKDLIIVRGTNHYPQDIEATVEAVHPAIRTGCVAAFATPSDGADQVIVVAELDPRAFGRVSTGIGSRDRLDRGALDVVALRRLESDIRRAVLEAQGLVLHDVVLVPPGGVARTTSGKVRRQAMAVQYGDGTIERIPAVASPSGALLQATGT